MRIHKGNISRGTHPTPTAQIIKYMYTVSKIRTNKEFRNLINMTEGQHLSCRSKRLDTHVLGSVDGRFNMFDRLPDPVA